jgi:hypothetical protein
MQKASDKANGAVTVFAFAPACMLDYRRLIKTFQFADGRRALGVGGLWSTGVLAVHVEHVVVAAADCCVRVVAWKLRV